MKLQKFLDEGPYKLVFAGFHLKDNILDEMTVEELQETVYSNIPNDKINVRTVQKEFESLLKSKIGDARFIAKKVIPELVKDLQGMVEDTTIQEGEQKIAKFSKKFKQLEYWTSRNTSTTVNCENMKKAKAIVKNSGVDQKIEVH